jgi:hypothetical protein
MGGPHLTIPCTLSSNGYSVQLKALADSGANGFVFINTPCAIDLAVFLNIKAQRLPRAVGVKGYDGQVKSAITHILRLHLTIDGRRQYHLPLMLLDLGSHDLILGRKWLAYFDILVDAKRRCLRWPKHLQLYHPVPKECSVQRETFVPKPLSSSYQADVEARDRAFGLEDKRPAAGRASKLQTANVEEITDEAFDSDSTNSTSDSVFEDSESTDSSDDTDLPSEPEETPVQPEPKPHALRLRQSNTRHTYKWDTLDNLRKMEDSLAGKVLIRLPLYKKKPLPKQPDVSQVATIDLAAISAVACHYNMKREENEAFTTSLYEIDRILEERYAEGEEYQLQIEQEKAQRKAAQRVASHTIGSIDNTEEDEDMDEWDKVPDCYAEFKDAFSKKASDKLPPHRPYDHKITLEKENDLGYSPLYKMTTEELEATKKYLIDNLHKGFIAPSQAPHATPVLFVKKPNGSLRFCIDFRKLNQITRKDQYPIPLIDETLARLGQAKIFTKLDIRQAFHRIRIDPDSEELTTFRTRYGSYKCKVLPFALTNGPATYQRYMNDVLFDYLDDLCTAYLDDILIYSDNELDHKLHVKKVLQRLRDAGLQADIKKCEFSVTKTKFLGFIVSTDGIEVDPEKVSVIRDWQAPDTVRGIQSFLGFCNFYRRFIRDYGKIAKPLVRLTKTGIPFKFDQICWEAFEELKARLTSSAILRHYNPNYESMIETDASDGVVAGVFLLEIRGNFLN